MFQRVVVIVKPHVNIDFPGQMGDIAIEAIEKYCNLELEVINCHKVTFSRAMAEEFYAEHKSQSFFPLLIDASTMGPCIALCVEGVDAIEKVRKLHGPTNPPDCEPGQLRKKYGRNERKRPFNAFHCTATSNEFLREYGVAFRK